MEADPYLDVSSVEEARRVQSELRARLVTVPTFELGDVRTVAGVDVSYSRRDDRMFAAVCVFSYPELEPVSCQSAHKRAAFPYVPGYLAFREIPSILSVIRKLAQLPDVVLVDGHGIAHPRGFGIASHLGVLLDVPTVGVAKKLLVGDYQEPGSEKGSYSPVTSGGKTIGAALRTRAGVKPVFVSPGHRVDLALSLRVVMSCTRGFRLPEPLRAAHREANALRAGFRALT